jgi:hypothetical protein
MTIARLLALTLLTLAHLHGSVATSARAETYTPSVTVTQRTVDVHVRADGSATTEVLQTLRIDTEQAVESHGEFRFHYSSRTGNFEVLEAWTITPDGQRLDVAPEKIRTLETSDTGEPSFSDGKVRVVIFPAVGVGAQLGYRLMGPMLLEQSDEWTLQRRYMQLEGLQSLSDTATLRLSAVTR